MKHIDLNDPRLTAYALGELTGPELDTVAALIEGDPDAMREVEEIRRVAGILAEELRAEPCPSLQANERRVVNHQLAELIQNDDAFSWGSAIGRFLKIFCATTAVAVLGVVLFELWGFQKREMAKFAKIDTPMASDESLPGALLPRTDLDMKPTDSEREQLARGTKLPAGVRVAPAPLLSPSMPTPEPARDLYSMRPGQTSKSTGRVMGQIGSGRAPSIMTGPSGHGMTSDQIRQRFNERLSGQNTETYGHINDNSFLAVAQNPLSTFSIDVDTASYANMRRFLTQNTLPPKDSVRIEELINYFTYAYAPPSETDKQPFAAHIESATCPWNTEHRLVRIGLKGKVISQEKRPPSNLVFLIDVSGSMGQPNKLPLVQQSMRLLTEQLAENDRVAMVVYAGSSGLVLPSTTGDKKNVILEALDRLSAGGSTHGSAGIQLAYDTAVANFIKGGANRVILCTDGDFNVGVTNQGDLQRLIEEKAKSGVFLSVLGFGMGNLKDATMETLADKGNGNYGYIDTLNEAKKLLVEQMSGTLITIAKDVKIQVEFNPSTVNAYRLIGYENRLLAKEDFNDDTKDAGEIGAGHTVTALYEVVPAGKSVPVPGVDPLKYQKPVEPEVKPTGSKELLTLKLRYKAPDGDTSQLLEYPFTDSDKSFGKSSTDFQFVSAVAMFGMILRDSPHKGGATMDGVLEIAESSVGADKEGYRREFVGLAKKAAQLMPPNDNRTQR